MKNLHFLTIACFALLLTSCAPSVELTTSWTNQQAKAKSDPKIMIMSIGKSLANKTTSENTMVQQFTKAGHNTVAALNFFNPNVQKIDSLAMVKVLQDNHIDLLLTNAVVNVIERERYVPGSTYSTPVYSAPIPTYPYAFGGYYGYYGYRSAYYGTMYETHTTEGYTTTEVEVLIESNLYDVTTGNLLWVGQSKSFTKEPTQTIFDDFSKNILNDLHKNHLLTKK